MIVALFVVGALAAVLALLIVATVGALAWFGWFPDELPDEAATVTTGSTRVERRTYRGAHRA